MMTMENEEWKLLVKFDKVHNNVYLPNDEIWISNRGRVMFNDILLSLDYGLYISDSQNQYDILLYKYKWPNDKFYRTVYTLFKGDILPKYNVHHVDGNHLNNNVDNLEQITFKEHMKVKDYYDYDDIDEIINNSLIGKDKFVKYLRERYIEYKRNKYIEEKLATGLYYLNKDGKVCAKTTKKKGKKVGSCPKLSAAIKLKWEDDEYRNKVIAKGCFSKDNRYDNSEELRELRKGCKLVIGDDGKKHWKYK